MALFFAYVCGALTLFTFKTKLIYLICMKSRINSVWNRVSRIGLIEGEGVHDRREVIFLNRMLALLPVIFLCYLPFEIYFNGTSMLPVVGLMNFLFLIPLILHHYRYFRFAHYYLFFIGNIMITGAGLLIGRGVDNHVTFIPALLIGIIIFKTKAERFLVLFITTVFFFLQQFLFDIISPEIYISDEIKSTFSNILFILALVLTFLIGFYFIGINSEYEVIVNDQKEAITIKNNEITSSITYAKRIQNAILPPASVVKELLPDSFILYKPKDIVAGDFYWIENINDTILFAAADSTGHGVPGAMVSVICNNALSRSVREFALTQPAHILDKAREIIIREFEKSEEEVKDGMDISLCALNFKTKTLHWAGANNPLLIIRNKEIIEIKPDKQPVGKFSGARPFTDHSIELFANDQIYIFSDGYADQFGGPDGKKFKYKALKQLLLDNHEKSMEEQKKSLDAVLLKWKGNLEQVDDICVIGVKI